MYISIDINMRFRNMAQNGYNTVITRMTQIRSVLAHLACLLLPILLVGCSSSAEPTSGDATLSSDTALVDLDIHGADLDIGFLSGTTTYTASVAYAVTSLTLTPVANDSGASFTVDGIAVVSGNASGSINLAEGVNGLTVTVTAEDGIATQTYSLAVTRAAASTVDASLAGLTIDGANLEQSFLSGTTTYTASVAYAVTSLTLTPVANDSGASITVDGILVASGSASGSISLAEGVNSLTVTVTAEDGIATQTYSLAVTRAAASTVDASLAGLTIDGPNLDLSFLSGTTTYTASVAYAVTSLTLTPIATVDAASITVNGTAVASGSASGSINLAEGVNSLTVTVTAEDGIATQTYSLAVTRAAASTVDASLAGLTVNGPNLDLSFLSGTTTYAASVAYGVTSLTLTPVATDSGASITVDGILVASGSASGSISLAEGVSSLAVTVTAEDGIATQTYSLAVTRTGDASLAGLTVKGADLDQTFQSNNATYTASVNYLTMALTLMPVATVSAASITVNGNAVISGNNSAQINLAEGDNTITVVITAEDGVGTETYTVDVTRASAAIFAQQAFLKASNAGENDSFGYSVALDGDTLVVGAVGEASTAAGGESNNDASYAGAVYIFTRNNGIWSQQAFLKASNAETGDSFGVSLALDGDTLVVGADDEASTAAGGQSNNDAANAGAAYVFTRSNGIWSQQAFLKASNAEEDDLFGVSVALDGDTLVLGATNEDSTDTGGENNNDASNAGAVYVFTRSNGIWSQQAFLKARNAEEDDYFGISVAVDGDTLVVGAYEEDSTAAGGENNNGASKAGAVYVFTRSNGIWSQQAFLKASNAEERDWFGVSIALDGDSLVVGAYGEGSTAVGGESNNDANDAGAVYVFTRSNGIWSQQAFLKASNAEAFDYFGYRVALDGDTLAVSADLEDSSATGGGNNNDASNAGAVYVFIRSNGIWTQQAFLKASNAESDDQFGGSVALEGDTLVVGAEGEDSTATGGQSNNDASSAGAVYVWQ